MKKAIVVKGARTHNLKNIDVEIPKNKLVVITGVSGSGKSSLAFDTLYAEGQRRYVESLSSYARQFLSMMEKPDVDSIDGLSPSISIEQKSTSNNPRSTVGTITEIYDYLRLLYARVGNPICPTHKVKLESQTISQIVDQILTLPNETKIMILAPVVRDKKGEYSALLQKLQSQGFVRVRINGDVYDIGEAPVLNKKLKHKIEVVIDRLKVNESQKTRIADSVETANRLSEGIVVINHMDGNNEDLLFSTKFACTECGYSISDLEPRMFSFNSPYGACQECDGLGRLIVPHKMNEPQVFVKCYMCDGNRLNPVSQSIYVGEVNIVELCNQSIENISKFFKKIKFKGWQKTIATKILNEINFRLNFLIKVGLNYLTLSRSAETLSGGESQRIRLASQIGAGLTGVMYVLDEPSIGLHQRDNDRLLQTLTDLRDLGNTIIVVEHDEDAILHADHVIDIGPFAGVLGGEIIAEGTPKQVISNPKSLTGKYLSGKEKIEIPSKRVPIDESKMITLEGATGNNLKEVELNIPVGLLTCVTGVSGSGKSSLINHTLYPLAHNTINKSIITPLPYKKITGLKEHFNKVIDIDQSPIGRTPRSNPATYVGIFNDIRDLFAQTPEAKIRGYQPGRFSFNVKGGRCEACEGDGLIRVEMHFLSDIFVTCDVCQGKRYNRETLEIRYKEKNISDVLNMDINEALNFFSAIPALHRKIKTLELVGLGYITLGQSATTLSGGEAQRVKLAKELCKRDTGTTLYILDEPTTGLHFHDIKQLLNVLLRLRDNGNTIVIIEHNLDVIKVADWIIDLGPEGGAGGGKIIAEGTPEQVAKVKGSHTGLYLDKILKQSL